MTYGWAILVVIIILSALYFLGVFNPKTPSTCSIQAPFVCNDFIATDMGITYSVGARGINNAQVTDMIINGQSCINNLNGTIANGNLAPNKITKVSCTGINLNAKQKVSAEIVINYTGRAGDLVHTIRGSGSGISEFATFSIFYDGLVFGWNGSTRYDYIGGIAGTLYGGLIAGNNQSGFFDNNATAFDGSDDYIQTPAITFNPSFTFSAWFNPSSSVILYGAVVTNLNHSAPPSGMSIIPASSLVRISYGNGTAYPSYFVTTSEIVLNQWSHAVVSYDGTNTKLYVNGILKDSRNIPLVSPASQVIRIGIWAVSHGDYFFNGTIDEVHVWNRALNSGEIQNLYNFYTL